MKKFINSALRYVFPATIALPIIQLAAALLGVAIPTGVSMAIGAVVVAGIILSCPTRNIIVRHDGTLTYKADPIFGLMMLPITSMGWLLAVPDNPSADMTLAPIAFLMIAMLIAMIAGMVLEIYLQVKSRPAYNAAKRAEADEALSQRIDALVATVPQTIRQDIAAQLADATYEQVEEVAKAVELLQEKAPQLLVQ